MSHNIVHISKFLSLILRHQPQTIGLEPGWHGCDAITGQLAGAYYGVNAIPQHWLEPLVMREEIRRLADELLRLRVAACCAGSDHL